jgi:hypothetical protein
MYKPQCLRTTHWTNSQHKRPLSEVKKLRANTQVVSNPQSLYRILFINICKLGLCDGTLHFQRCSSACCCESEADQHYRLNLQHLP